MNEQLNAAEIYLANRKNYISTVNRFVYKDTINYQIEVFAKWRQQNATNLENNNLLPVDHYPISFCPRVW